MELKNAYNYLRFSEIVNSNCDAQEEVSARGRFSSGSCGAFRGTVRTIRGAVWLEPSTGAYRPNRREKRQSNKRTVLWSKHHSGADIAEIV